MATIHKLTKDGSTIFPATITDAIVHPNTGKTLTSMIKDYNVSELFPSEGIDGGNRYNLALAIQVLGSHLTAAEKTGGIKITFISSSNPYPEEEYFLQKNTWSTTLSDWGQRFEVGDVVANPSGSWSPSTAEEYIDQQTAILNTNITAETTARQVVDSNLQTQINSEVSNRNQIDNTQNTKISALEDAYRGLTESDVIVGPRPSSGQQANVIYREPDQEHTPPQFYCDYMWYNNAWVLMAQYDNGIDNNPTPGSNNLVKSSGVYNNMGAFDVSVYNGGTIYQSLSAALNAVPQAMQTGGMSIKFVQEVTPSQYSVVKTEGETTQPTGTALVTDPNIISGTYTADQLSNFASLPSTLNSSLTYYLETSGTYTTWVITYVQTSDNKYVQYRLMATTFSTTPSNWQGVDDNPTFGSKNYVESGVIYNALKNTVANIRNKTISLEIGGLINGLETDNPKIIRTSYIKFPYHIKVATGYVIKQQANYQFVNNAASVTQYSKNVTEIQSYTYDNRLVRFTIAKTDDTDITQSDLDNCISEFGYDGCDNNIEFLKNFENYYMNIPFEVQNGVGYNSSGVEVTNANFAKVDIDLTSYNMRKINFLYGVSSTASCGFIINGTFNLINYTEAEKVPGTNYYNIIRDIPNNATAIHISWAKTNLPINTQKISGNLLVKDTIDLLTSDINTLDQGQRALNNLIESIKIDFSAFEITKTLSILPNGINVSDGSEYQNYAYNHVVVDLTRNMLKTISFKYAYVSSAVATYGFIVNGVWQGVHLDVQNTSGIYDKTVNVPDGATQFLCVWNINVITQANKKVYGYGMPQFELVQKDIEESQNKTINIVKETNQLNLTFNLAKIPTIQAGGSFDGSKTISDFYSMYDALASAHSYYVTKIDCDAHAQDVLGITKPSQLDGLPIYMYKCIPSIGLNENSQSHKELVTQRPKILITSMHPQEQLGDFAIYNLFKTLCEAWNGDETIAALRSFADIYIIPFSWPWNYAHISRVNYNGVNPNRNFPTRGWTESGQGTDNYTGPSPLSEYEAKVLDLYVQEINPDIVLDVHTSDQTSTGLMGIIIYNNSDTPLNKLVPIICRTTSNQAISDNNNYPQANPDRTLYKPYPDNYGGLKGEFFEYCYEAGITYSMLCEHSPYSRWDNGNFDLSWPIKESHTDGILRQQEQWAFNIIARCFREVASKYYCLY